MTARNYKSSNERSERSDSRSGPYEHIFTTLYYALSDYVLYVFVLLTVLCTYFLCISNLQAVAESDIMISGACMTERDSRYNETSILNSEITRLTYQNGYGCSLPNVTKQLLYQCCRSRCYTDEYTLSNHSFYLQWCSIYVHIDAAEGDDGPNIEVATRNPECTDDSVAYIDAIHDWRWYRVHVSLRSDQNDSAAPRLPRRPVSIMVTYDVYCNMRLATSTNESRLNTKATHAISDFDHECYCDNGRRLYITYCLSSISWFTNIKLQMLKLYYCSNRPDIITHFGHTGYIQYEIHKSKYGYMLVLNRVVARVGVILPIGQVRFVSARLMRAFRTACCVNYGDIILSSHCTCGLAYTRREPSVDSTEVILIPTVVPVKLGSTKTHIHTPRGLPVSWTPCNYMKTFTSIIYTIETSRAVRTQLCMEYDIWCNEMIYVSKILLIFFQSYIPHTCIYTLLRIPMAHTTENHVASYQRRIQTPTLTSTSRSLRIQYSPSVMHHANHPNNDQSGAQLADLDTRHGRDYSNKTRHTSPKNLRYCGYINTLPYTLRSGLVVCRVSDYNLLIYSAILNVCEMIYICIRMILCNNYIVYKLLLKCKYVFVWYTLKTQRWPVQYKY